MEPLARHLLTEAFNNAWAAHRLLGACAALTRAEFAAPRTGFFPSIAATLNHEPIARLLAHLFQHQTHHRGQAHSVWPAE